MRIGVPGETKPSERRVALVPRDIALLSGDGHDVGVQEGGQVGARGSPTTTIDAPGHASSMRTTLGTER